ncbi:type II toxin-antitoxin system VapC family toxin [Silvibacterium sp.]|uniref:type II toxin-antitoxin system VapC family toxin n=1 Tax=Silvibacterium sp. TaxID=1964179 RepID=UPI0039E3CDB0
MNVYADTSFFASVYLPDQHTANALRRLAAKPRIWMTPFHRLELAHAISQKVYRDEIPQDSADRVQALLAQDCELGVWAWTEFPGAAFVRGVELARLHVPKLGCRSLDTLHVAAAMEFGSQQFWTFDERQAKLARAVRLKST